MCIEREREREREENIVRYKEYKKWRQRDRESLAGYSCSKGEVCLVEMEKEREKEREKENVWICCQDFQLE